MLNWEPGPSIEEFPEILSQRGFTLPQRELRPDGWRLESPLKLQLLEKLRLAGPSLGESVNGRFYYGIKTGLNEAFVVDCTTRDRLIGEHKSSVEILKPYLRGRDVKRWNVEPANLWLIFTRRGIDIKKYPAVLEHLKSFKRQLMPGSPGGRKAGSYEWYEIQDNVAYWKEFEGPKIITGRFMNYPTFAYDDESYFNNNGNSIIAGATPYLAGVLNSLVAWWFLTQTCTDLQNGYLQAHNENLAAVPVPNPKTGDERPVGDLVCQILARRKRDSAVHIADLEAEIDGLIAHLYGLTEDEYRLILDDLALPDPVRVGALNAYRETARDFVK